jgi:hypothetical protein
MVDAFTEYAASALAATSVVRSIFGTCLPMAGLPMYATLGYGWVWPPLERKGFEGGKKTLH